MTEICIVELQGVNTSFKSYDFACTNRDMPQCGKWNVFVPYDYIRIILVNSM